MIPFLPRSASGPLLVLLAALLLDGLLPPMTGFAAFAPNPVRLMRGLGRALARRLDRARRSDRTRLIRGALVTLIVALLAYGIGWAVERASLRQPYGVFLALVAAVLLLGQRRIFANTSRVARALARGPAGLADARAAVAPLVGPGWDAGRLDSHGVARAAIEATVFGFAEQVVAPAFWFVLAGLPGMFVAVSINAVAARGAPQSRFAVSALRSDDLLGYVPARLAGLLLAVAAVFAATAHPLAAWRGMPEARKHRSLNRGWPIAVAAGALGLALGGPRHAIGGDGVPQPWIGSGRARAEATDLRRALYLFAVACILNAACVAALTLFAQAPSLDALLRALQQLAQSVGLGV